MVQINPPINLNGNAELAEAWIEFQKRGLPLNDH